MLRSRLELELLETCQAIKMLAFAWSMTTFGVGLAVIGFMLGKAVGAL